MSAAILAGGRARRFGGRDKSRLVIEGRAIIVRQIEVIERVTSSIVVVADDPARFADLPVIVHRDLIPGCGAIGGVYTALATSRTDRVIVVACDMPFLEDRLLARLVAVTGDADGAWVRSSRGVEPLLACYRTAAAGRVREAIERGDLKAADLAMILTMNELDESDVAVYGPPDRLLANLNTPDDLARVQ